MIDHTGINVSDFSRSKKFYLAALAPLGYEALVEFAKTETQPVAVAGLGEGGKPDFWLIEGTPNKPHVHVAFRAKSKAEVDAFYEAALAAGGQDNGPPGPRPHYHAGYYGAFVSDFDGHNIEAVFHG